MNHAVRTLSMACHSNEKFLPFTVDLRCALEQLRRLLIDSTPLRISKALGTAWIIFTDGAYEPDSPHPSTVGGILVSPCGVITEYFGEQLMQTLTKIFYMNPNTQSMNWKCCRHSWLCKPGAITSLEHLSCSI